MQLSTQEQITARFEELPDIVQDAILESDVSSALRSLYEESSLHLDKWEVLQRIVMSGLVGLIPTNSIAAALSSELGTDELTTAALVEGLAARVFQPVREHLERGLGHPQAKDEVMSDVEMVRQQVLAAEKSPAQAEGSNSPAPQPIPGTPPPPKPEDKVVRGPASGAYKPGEASHERKGITDDPYREAVL